MPITTVSPNSAKPYYQVIFSSNVQVRVVLTTSHPIIFLAMLPDEFNKYLNQQPANAFNQATVPATESHPVEFLIPGNTPWVMVFVNKNAESAAVYWQNFMRPV